MLLSDFNFVGNEYCYECYIGWTGMKIDTEQTNNLNKNSFSTDALCDFNAIYDAVYCGSFKRN